MRHFMMLIPGYAYAIDVYGVDEDDAKRNYREQYGLSRLKSGTVIWEKDK